MLTLMLGTIVLGDWDRFLIKVKDPWGIQSEICLLYLVHFLANADWDKIWLLEKKILQ